MAFRIFFVAVTCVLLHTTDAFSNPPRTSKAFQSSSKILYSDLSAESGSGGIPTLFSLANKLTSSKFYSGIETVIVIGLLSAIDGGFSGDWSRLGYITTETEAAVRSAITSVGLFHLVCTPIAVLSAAKNKQPVVPAALHTLLIGGLGLGKVLFQNEDQLIDFPNVKQGFANAVAGKYDELAVSQSIDDVVDSNAVVMFSFTSCPYCIKAKQLLIDDLGVNVKGT
jgi:Glutaredoxin